MYCFQLYFYYAETHAGRKPHKPQCKIASFHSMWVSRKWDNKIDYTGTGNHSLCKRVQACSNTCVIHLPTYQPQVWTSTTTQTECAAWGDMVGWRVCSARTGVKNWLSMTRADLAECFGGCQMPFRESQVTYWEEPNCRKKSILSCNAVDIMLKLFIVWRGTNHGVWRGHGSRRPPWIRLWTMTCRVLATLGPFQ